MISVYEAVWSSPRKATQKRRCGSHVWLIIVLEVKKLASHDKVLLWVKTAHSETLWHLGIRREVFSGCKQSWELEAPLWFSRLLPLVFNLRNSVYRFKDFSNEIQRFSSRN